MSHQASTLRITIIGLVSLSLAIGIARFAFTPLLPMMREDGLISISEGGVLASVHFLGYWLGAVFVEKIPLAPKQLLRLSLFGIALGTIGMGATDNYAAWLIIRWLVGVFSAWTLMLVSNYYVKYLADHHQSARQGWVFSGVGAGITFTGFACLFAMVNNITSPFGWQIIGGTAIVAVAFIVLNLGNEIPSERATANKQLSPRSPLNWRVVIAYGATGIGYIIPATYLPVMARDIVQSPLVFGWSWPIFGTAAFISTIIAAMFQKRFSNREIWSASHVVMAVGLLGPAIYPHILTIILAGLCVGGTFMTITMTGMKEAHRLAPPTDVMRHIAFMTAAFATGQMIGPVFASVLFDLTQSFTPSLVATSILLLVTAVALVKDPV